MAALIFDPAYRPLLLFGTASNVYSFVLVVLALRHGDWLTDQRFSLTKFYVLMGWVPLAFVSLALLISPRYLALFVAAGLLGIVGELIVSVVWRRFFAEPIWTYSYRSVLAGYTSTLNFLPWAVGALLFCETRRVLGGAPPAGLALDRPLWVCAAALAAGVLVAWPLSRLTSARERRFTKRAFAVFCIPIAFTGAGLAALVSPHYLLLMAAFALVGFLTEYTYGRGMSLFFERGLWTYNHWKIDHGHTSFVTFPLWALGGLYFHFIAGFVGL
ncbi:MAG: hypothetical protein HS104_37260 [Polyangiaceae bacterium]|nr:hypothetical protein [Polyangiaceae bacterium]MBK9002005.1 hypothetical protein [Myxococcales bacterium]MCL4751032.1 hypothetical protein [Myxococcales bacterium]